MDTEMFSTEAYRGGVIGGVISRDISWFVQLTLALLCAFLIMCCVSLGFDIAKKVKQSDKFTQKEGLQYLGASADITRDDTGWTSKDSLAEMALASQSAVTSMGPVAGPAPVRSTFYSRERIENPADLAEQKKRAAMAGH